MPVCWCTELSSSVGNAATESEDANSPRSLIPSPTFT
jgi:hypothetical protein